MLPKSRLYSFIDQHEGFTLHFLEGQKLVHDIVITHNLNGIGFTFFRDILLSTQLLLAYLKPGEGLGIYLDSEEPFFKFKIEMSESGKMRTLLLPEELKDFPKKITGKCRLSKTSPGEKSPYVSIVNLADTALEDIINTLLSVSYQLKCQIYLSSVSDQSLMISKLPSIDINRIQTHYTLSVSEYWSKHEKDFNDFLQKFSCDYLEIQTFFESKGLILLSTREICFECSCSHERMAHGIWLIIKSAGIDHVFMADEKEIETKCDYCKKTYTFSRNDFLI